MASSDDIVMAPASLRIEEPGLTHPLNAIRWSRNTAHNAKPRSKHRNMASWNFRVTTASGAKMSKTW